MRTTFFGLETARRALMAQQLGLETTAHNIANANTPGYSRQVVQLQSTTPFSPPSLLRPQIPGQIGTGVGVGAIQRMRNAFVDTQVRQETSSLGRWETQRDLLMQVELIYNEPSESGIRNSLDAFWQSLQDLSLNPESGSARTVVLQRGQALADLLNHTYTQLKDLQSSVNDTIEVQVGEVNTYAKKIASLNRQIVEASSMGDNPNDLMDQRDLLITELSKIVDVNVHTDKYNAATVTIGGIPLVEWDQVRELKAEPDADGKYQLKWAKTGNPVEFHNGSLKGLLVMRDEQIDGHIGMITNFSNTLVAEFNAQYSKGYDLEGNKNPDNVFFEKLDPDDDKNPLFRVRTGLTEKDIAASAGGAPGNGQNASKLADVLNVTSYDFSDTKTTLRDYLSSNIAKLGVETQHALRMTDNQQTLVAHLENRQEMVAGVSLDEEMVNMIKFQHAYNAAARIITGFDEMYDTIINRMGLVGR